MQLRVHDQKPQKRGVLNGEEFFADAAGPGTANVSQKKSNISTKRSSQARQLIPWNIHAVETLQAEQGCGGITAAPAQSGSDGNVLVDPDADTAGVRILFKKKFRRAPDRLSGPVGISGSLTET